jgi:hypothetical protein
MKLGICLLTVWSSLLFGCATHSIDEYYLDAPAVGPQASFQRGVVIGSMESNHKALGLFKGTLRIFFKIDLADANTVDPNGEPKRLFELFDDRLDKAATEPGRYHLFSVIDGPTLDGYIFESWNKANGYAYGGFAVKPGEVIYIGHLVMDPQEMTLKMRVEDRFDEMKTKLPPELASRIVKRLIALPPSITFDSKEYGLAGK